MSDEKKKKEINIKDLPARSLTPEEEEALKGGQMDPPPTKTPTPSPTPTKTASTLRQDATDSATDGITNDGDKD